MENKVEYKSASKYSEAYADLKNVDLLNKYAERLDKIEFKNDNGEVEKLNYKDIKHLKLCLLFAGALIDEKMGFGSTFTKRYKETREYYQKSIDFDLDDWRVIRKNLEDLCNALIKEDKANSKHYQNVYKQCKEEISNLYNERHDKIMDDFMKAIER